MIVDVISVLIISGRYCIVVGIRLRLRLMVSEIVMIIILWWFILILDSMFRLVVVIMLNIMIILLLSIGRGIEVMIVLIFGSRL